MPRVLASEFHPPPRESASKTHTSAFGSPGRRGHDSSRFYAGRLYHDQPSERDVPYVENPLPPADPNTIFPQSSARRMRQLPDCSVHLMVTSPPYNVGKEYDDDLTLPQYRAFLRRVMREVHRVLVPGGRVCFNIANLGRRPYLPLHRYVIEDLLRIGFLMRGEIIWDKAASAASSTAWGSWQSAANPTLRDVHEYILVLCKDTYRRPKVAGRESTIARDDFLDWTRSVWQFPAESARRVGHPAPFPVELPRRCIELYTYAGEVVLDPFMGSGTTAIAALQTGRQFVGYETSQDYRELAHRRLSAIPTLFTRTDQTGRVIAEVRDAACTL
ncbi:MAG: site-specific DNA-methyltransferase [Chloroflexi bacterium]|nr:site-specific DNA-methyltransferase [Chloroflexota bacterium]